jgi:hypothetical protein
LNWFVQLIIVLSSRLSIFCILGSRKEEKFPMTPILMFDAQKMKCSFQPMILLITFACCAFSDSFGGPEQLGGVLNLSPSAVSWAQGRLDVFGIDANTDQLAHWWWENGWGGPELLGGNLASAPSAVSWAAGRLDVFGTDHAGVLDHWWFPGP